MACRTCGGQNYAPVNKTATKAVEKSTQLPDAPVVEKSDNPKAKVRLRFYGAGLVRQTSGSGCVSCGGSRGYTMRTSETISFVSEDAIGGYFQETFHAGHDYYVTEKQAEYLLTLTYYDRGGQKLHKFKKVED